MFVAPDYMQPFAKKLYLSSPTMHGEELIYMKEAFDTNWMSTVGENIDRVEEQIAQKLGGYAVALSSGTAALHLAMKLGGIKPGDLVFSSDMTFSATTNPVVYEGARQVFIDTERDTWNMDPEALEQAFSIYPGVKAVVLANLYGTPGKLDELVSIAHRHGAIVIEDAAESLGASYKGRQTGLLGDIGVISFNGNKIITGSAGGMLLTHTRAEADKARKWSTQSRENAPWYQHEELGYNYRMSNVIAGVVRGQLPYLEEHIAQKRAIYMRYKEGFKDLPVTMNPYDGQNSQPNFWLSCLLLQEEAMCPQVRSDTQALYTPQTGRSCPTEILETLARYNAEGRPLWKPMHLQPLYRMHPFVTARGNGRGQSNAYISGEMTGAFPFHAAVCPGTVSAFR